MCKRTFCHAISRSHIFFILTQPQCGSHTWVAHLICCASVWFCVCACEHLCAHIHHRNHLLTASQYESQSRSEPWHTSPSELLDVISSHNLCPCFCQHIMARRALSSFISPISLFDHLNCSAFYQQGTMKQRYICCCITGVRKQTHPCWHGRSWKVRSKSAWRKYELALNHLVLCGQEARVRSARHLFSTWLFCGAMTTLLKQPSKLKINVEIFWTHLRGWPINHWHILKVFDFITLFKL